MEQRLINIIGRLLCGLKKDDTEECSYYEGILEDAITEAEELLHELK